MVHSDGNLLSTLAFFVWIPIALWGARRWPPAKAAALLLLLPLMFLPERVEFDLPGLPPLTKTQLAIFWLLIGVLLFHRQRLKALHLSVWIKLPMFALLAGRILTVFLNTDPVFQGSIYLPGHGAYDAVNVIVLKTFDYILPFVLAAAMFRDASDLRVLFRMLVGATLIYGVFQLIELRLSPQFNYWVYGYYQHMFLQMMRGDSFRPMVFMAHGITVAMFTMVGLLAAATLYKANIKVFGIPPAWSVGILWVLALLNKSLAAFLYTLVGVPLLLFFRPKTGVRVAMVLTFMALTYPVFRSADLIPVQWLDEVAQARFGEERAESLMTRFTNEQALLARAKERPIFGWGTYCRPCIHDPWTGKQTSIADGEWVITIGEAGAVGFLSKYLLLLLPVFMAARRLRAIPRELDRRFVAALALMLGFSTFDLIPNSSAHYLPFVFAGALYASSTQMARNGASQKQRDRGRSQAPIQSHGAAA
ncbi:MAG: hypothetical protein WCE62_15480 [Polyangiales bacterium]